MSAAAFSGLGLLAALYCVELPCFLLVRSWVKGYGVERSDLADLVVALAIAGLAALLHAARLSLAAGPWALPLLLGEIALTAGVVAMLAALPGGDSARHTEMNQSLVNLAFSTIVLGVASLAFHTSVEWGSGLLLVLANVATVVPDSSMSIGGVTPLPLRLYALLASAANVSLGVLLMFR